jgi:hypothetical protein
MDRTNDAIIISVHLVRWIATDMLGGCGPILLLRCFFADSGLLAIPTALSVAGGILSGP